MRLRYVMIMLLLVSLSTAAEETNTTPLTTLMVRGVIYSNVTWGAVTPATVTIVHKTGIAKIPLEQLPPELQKRFHYNPRTAASYRAAEAQQAAQALTQQRELQERKAQEEADKRAAEQAAKRAEERAQQALAAKQNRGSTLGPVILLNFSYSYNVTELPDGNGNCSAWIVNADDNQYMRVKFSSAGMTYMQAATRVRRTSTPGYGWGPTASVGGMTMPYSVYGQAVTQRKLDIYGMETVDRYVWLVGTQMFTVRGGPTQYSW